MLVLVLDSSSAALGAAQAIEICIQTAIPVLFPFFVLSSYLLPRLSLLRIPVLSRLLGIPEGWESVFILGFMGGYPVGAQCIAQGYSSNGLTRRQAERMLGFCTNCGPAFIFGVLRTVLPEPKMPWLIAFVGIVSAMLVGIVWPTVRTDSSGHSEMAPIPLTQCVQQALRSMASVCAWIILGRVLLTFLKKWLLWRLPAGCISLVSGLMELTNGCLILADLSFEKNSFIIASIITGFGGLCVAMQVCAICHRAKLPWNTYLPQKLLQALFCAILSGFYHVVPLPVWIAGCSLLVVILKMTVEIFRTVLYNRPSKGGRVYAVSKKDSPLLSLLRAQHET